jgi:hypothetical protein
MNNKQKFHLYHSVSLLLYVILAYFVSRIVTALEHGFGFVSWVFLFASVAGFIAYGVWITNAADIKREDAFYDTNYKKALFKGFNFSIVFILLFGGLVYLGYKITKQSIVIYNTSKIYVNKYDQKTKERLGYYDNMWKTYSTKNSIAGVNKDIFIEVAKIQMEPRKDGASVAWKWVSENSQIPYHEFTAFYKDLSSFIETQRGGYYALEKACQEIATQHNMLIDTFPNNMYNKYFVKRPKIEYEYGFLSDSTNKVFKSGKENPF